MGTWQLGLRSTHLVCMLLTRLHCMPHLQIISWLRRSIRTTRLYPLRVQLTLSLATTPCRQHTLSATVESTQFNSLLSESSTAGKARLLSVSLPHASSWLSAIPSPGLGLSLDPNEHLMVIKWWLGLDTSPGSPPCALCPEHALDPIGHHALT